MKKILLISIPILLLVGFGKSDFDKCLDAESAKVVTTFPQKRQQLPRSRPSLNLTTSFL